MSALGRSCRRGALHIASVALVLAVIQPAAHAQNTYNWTSNGGASWTSQNNWTTAGGNNNRPGANGSTTDTAVFATVGSGFYASNNDNSPSLTIANLNVTRNAAWSISGNPLTVSNGPSITTGALLINNTLNTVGFSVAGTLGGTGSVVTPGSTTTVNGRLSPGGTAGATLVQSLGTLTMTGAAFAAGSIFEVGLGAGNGAGTSDMLNTSALGGANTLSFANTTTLRLVNNGYNATSLTTYTIASYNGTNPFTGNVIIDSSAIPGGNSYSLSTPGGGILQLTSTPVPEPVATLAIMFAGMGAVACVRRLRRQMK